MNKKIMNWVSDRDGKWQSILENSSISQVYLPVDRQW